jgi:hypothetical protein
MIQGPAKTEVCYMGTNILSWENKVFGLCPSFDVLKTHIVSKTGSVSTNR